MATESTTHLRPLITQPAVRALNHATQGVFFKEPSFWGKCGSKFPCYLRCLWDRPRAFILLWFLQTWGCVDGALIEFPLVLADMHNPRPLPSKPLSFALWTLSMFNNNCLQSPHYAICLVAHAREAFSSLALDSKATGVGWLCLISLRKHPLRVTGPPTVVIILTFLKSQTPDRQYSCFRTESK